jgi:predicted dehydrogenase
MWPYTVVTDDLSRAGRQRAVEEGPYGRCVFRAGNTVVDHQVVTMESCAGASVVLVMHGHSHQESRTMRYDGTRATLRGRFTLGKNEISVHDHLTDEVERFTFTPAIDAHGGGDSGVMADFVRVLRGEMEPPTPAGDAVASHLLAFAAEDARATGAWVDLLT